MMAVDPIRQIESFQNFIDLNYKKKLHELIQKGKKSLVIDFNDLAKFDIELAEQLLSDPEDTTRAAELALEHFEIPKKTNIRIRISNLPKSQDIMIRNIRSEHINKLLSFEGLVRQSSDVRPQVTSAKFECPSCGNTISILQVDTRFKEPTRCTCGRRGRFRLISKDLVDAQRLVLEEAPESLEGGEQPKRLSVFLKEDLVEPKMEKKTTPGSKINVIGIIKEVPVMLRTGAQSIRYDLMADANHIEPLEQTFEDIEINKEDELQIKTLAKDPKIYEKLISSIAPSIYGHEDVKEAILLQLMGGVKKQNLDGTKTRGDMHILLVGDPGSGKSRMLQFVSKAAPKARYVSGKGATAAGLTATVIKDEFLRGWALEAGAIVLSNFGIVCLDELDKTSEEDTSALHEAMEQQTITIAKANIQATLRAETTVLAAANPKLGRFDPYQMIAQQIDMPPTLINRFDLIFPIRDLPNKELDERIAKHVLGAQRKPDIVEAPISTALLKKYIAYVKQNVFPKLTKEAEDEIKHYYVSLRNSTTTSEEAIRPIPISPRQLEALVRLSEGSAKVRLSNEVKREDAKRAINLLNNCLKAVGFDYETGQIDIDRITTGVSASQRGKIAVIKDIIGELENKFDKKVPIEEIKKEAESKGINSDKVDEVIDKMKREGLIFEPKRGYLSKI